MTLSLRGFKSVLETCTKFYLPSVHPEAKDEIEKFQTKVNEIAGGSTLYNNVEGSWINDDGKLYKEHVCVLEVYHSLDKDKELEILKAFIEFGKTTEQETLAIAENNRLSIIPVDERLIYESSPIINR